MENSTNTAESLAEEYQSQGYKSNGRQTADIGWARYYGFFDGYTLATTHLQNRIEELEGALSEIKDIAHSNTYLRACDKIYTICNKVKKP